jgi:hypothetical protein
VCLKSLVRYSRCVSTDTGRIPTRSAMLKSLSSGSEFDVLIIGAGATGSGIP